MLDIAQFETLSHTVDKNCFKLCWYYWWEESPESCNPFDIRNHSTSNKIEVVCLLLKFSLCFSVYYSSHFMFISFDCYWYGAVSIEIENIWFEYMNGTMLNNGFQCSVRGACVCARVCKWLRVPRVFSFHSIEAKMFWNTLWFAFTDRTYEHNSFASVGKKHDARN